MRATSESRKKFESIYRQYGYETMADFAKAANLNYSNLSRVMSGRQGEGNIIVRIAKFLGVPYNELRQKCGFCGTEGEDAIEELSNDFQGHHNTTVVGNSNNVMTNNSFAGVTDDELLNAILGDGKPGKDALKKLSDVLVRLARLEAENKLKDEQIRRLEEDKAFLQGLLKKK